MAAGKQRPAPPRRIEEWEVREVLRLRGLEDLTRYSEAVLRLDHRLWRPHRRPEAPGPTWATCRRSPVWDTVQAHAGFRWNHPSDSRRLCR